MRAGSGTGSPDADRPEAPPEDLRRAAEAGCRLTGLRAASRHARVHGAVADGRPAVLKVAAGPGDPVGCARFAREGRLGLALRHPGLVETLRCGAGWILLADLRDGPGPAPSLHDRIRAAGPDPALAAGLGGVAAALAHLHARGLVHRDVKPGNILIAAGRPVLIDLGAVGLAVGDDLGAGEIVGSPAWMAPEQIRGRPPRAEADVWSLALVLAHALCGVPAFAGSADAVLRHRRAGCGPGPDFARGLDRIAEAGLRDLVLAGLSEDPAARPPIGAFARLAAAAPFEP